MARIIRLGTWIWHSDTLELRNDTHLATLEPRVARLFEFLIEHQGELLSHDRLVEAVWDGRVISIEAVRHAVFSLRQAFATDGSENYIRTVHKKGYIASFPTPQATEQRSQSDLSSALDVNTTSPEIDPSSTPPAIAVLPFTNVSEQDTGQFLADGLTDELLAALERNYELRVTARNSTFQFKDKQIDARELGRRLGVRYLLEGRVSSSADELQVRPRLIDTQTGGELWADTYERSPPEWFALQQQVTEAVAGAVQSRLHGDAHAITLPPRVASEEAQMELLRARQLLITRSVADAEQAIEHLQRALTLDPNYALAYARLADAILIQAESTTGINAARPAVAPLLEKALTLDPGLGEAYALRSRLTDDRAAAERDLRRGLELNPSYARGYEMLANLQFALPQQMDLANDSIDTAIALDPLTPGNLHTKATFMMMRGNYSEAINLDSRALKLNPEFRAALALLGFMSGVEGNFANAVYYAERALALDPRTVQLRELLTVAYLAVGELDSVRVLDDPPTPFGQLALVESAGDMAQAADSLYRGRFGPLEKMLPEAKSQIILRQALADGDFARALAWLTPLLPFADGLPPNTIGWNLLAYANLKLLLDANGNTDEASRLQEQMEALMGQLETRFPRHAIIHNQVRPILLAHAGREEEACATLERAYSPVPRPGWWLVLGNPAFDNMRSAPCFLALLAPIEAHVAVEREAIEVMRRAGKIPDRTGSRSKQADATSS